MLHIFLEIQAVVKTVGKIAFKLLNFMLFFKFKTMQQATLVIKDLMLKSYFTLSGYIMFALQ